MNLVRRVDKLEERAVQLLQVRAQCAPQPLPLEQPADVLALLSEQINVVRQEPMTEPIEKARTLGMLAGLALRAMEARDLEARLEAVERVLKLRQQNEREREKNRRQ